MVTSVWLFKPRSHGRKKEGSRARNGAPLPGRPPSFRLPHRSASSALCPCGHAASFRRRVSSFVRGVRCFGVRRRCLRRRCYASARGARGVQCGVRARGAALWPLLLLRRRRVCCDCRGGGCAWRGGCAHGGCVARAVGAVERWGWRPAVGAVGVRAGSPVPVLEMPLMPPQAVGAAVTVPRGEWSVFMASLAARVARQRAGRRWCWRGAGGRCRSWPQRGRRRPLRVRRLSGRGSGRVR